MNYQECKFFPCENVLSINLETPNTIEYAYIENGTGTVLSYTNFWKEDKVEGCKPVCEIADICDGVLNGDEIIKIGMSFRISNNKPQGY